MKRIYTLFFLASSCLVFLSQGVHACNSCSQVSVVSDNGLLLQNVLNDYVSLQARRASFSSQNLENEQSNDRLLNYELMFKKRINKKIYAWAAIPYHTNHREINFQTALQNSGLGDVRVGFDYRFKPKQFSDSVSLTPIITLGAKAPTGHYEHYIISQGMPRSFNTGTGAWGGFANASVRWRKKKLGGVLSAAYFLQGKNKYEYQYGHQQNVTTTIFYNFFSKKQTNILPMLGMTWDGVSSDFYRGEKQTVSTGGSSTMAQIGCTILRESHVFSVEANLPMVQSYASHSVMLNNVCTARYTFLIKNKNQRNKKNTRL